MTKPKFGIIKTQGSFVWGIVWNNHSEMFALYFCLGFWMANVAFEKEKKDDI